MMLSFEFLQRFQGLLQTGHPVGRVGKSGGGGGGAGKNAGRNEIVPSHPNVPGYRNKCMHACVCVAVCACAHTFTRMLTHTQAFPRLDHRGTPVSVSRASRWWHPRALSRSLSLSFSLSLSLSFSLTHSLARSFSRMLSLYRCLSFSLVCVCLSHTHMLEHS